MWGVLVAAPLLWSFTQLVPKAMTQYSYVMYGVLLVVMLVLRPEGLIDRRLVFIIRTQIRTLFKQLVSFRQQNA